VAASPEVERSTDVGEVVKTLLSADAVELCDTIVTDVAEGSSWLVLPLDNEPLVTIEMAVTGTLSSELDDALALTPGHVEPPTSALTDGTDEMTSVLDVALLFTIPWLEVPTAVTDGVLLLSSTLLVLPPNEANEAVLLEVSTTDESLCSVVLEYPVSSSVR